MLGMIKARADAEIDNRAREIIELAHQLNDGDGWDKTLEYAAREMGLQEDDKAIKRAWMLSTPPELHIVPKWARII